MDEDWGYTYFNPHFLGAPMALFFHLPTLTGWQALGYAAGSHVAPLGQKIRTDRLDMGRFHSHGGTQKWMVFVRENPMKIGDLGVPPFQKMPIC